MIMYKSIKEKQRNRREEDCLLSVISLRPATDYRSCNNEGVLPQLNILLEQCLPGCFNTP